jgi:hypothetical protein
VAILNFQMAQTVTTHVKDKIYFMRQLFCLGLQIWISEMLQYYPELEVVELVQDGPIFFWDHLLPIAHVNSFLHYLAVSYK